MKAVPFVLLGAALTVGSSLIVGGCIAADNSSALYILIPALISSVCVYGIHQTIDDNGSWGDDSLVSLDGWFFALFVCVSSMFALPSVLYHIGTIKTLKPFVLDVSGCCVILIGFGIQYYITKSDDFQQF